MKKGHKQNKSEKLDEVLLDLRRTMTEALKDEAKSLGLSLPHFEVLKFVVTKADPSLKAIANHLRITPPSASALTEGLVKAGYLKRIQAEADRREIRVMLTQKSGKLFASLHKSKASIFGDMVKSLKEEDKNHLARLLSLCIKSYKKKI